MGRKAENEKWKGELVGENDEFIDVWERWNERQKMKGGRKRVGRRK